MDILDILADALGDAKKTLGELPGGEGKSPRVLWLERQLVNVVSELEAMLADVEAGISISDMGFFGDADCADLIENLVIEIANLRSLIRAELGIAR